MKLCVVAGIHGNERFGLRVLEMLKGEDVQKVVANKEALKENRRFIDTDLNRSFPGNPLSPSYEERRAYELLKEIRCNKVIDLHSSTSNTPPFAIIVNTKPETLNLAMSTGVRRICLMTPALANGRSLIDHVRAGISLEMGRHEDPFIIIRAYEFIMNALRGNARTTPEFYEITGVEKDMNTKARNFEFNGKYYPVLVDEASYKGIKCLKARKVSGF